MFGKIGVPEILLILAVLLMLFGARRIPEIARALGKSLTEFRKGREDNHPEAPDDKSPPPPAAPKT